MKYPRNEIWERKAYETLVSNGQLTLIFRPENRICDGQSDKCFYEGEELKLRILEKPGDEQGAEPVFSKTERKVRISRMTPVFIASLKEGDFSGSSPDVQNQEQLKYHLGIIYNKTPESFNEVTKIELEYLDKQP